ncbi:cobalt transporter ApaG [Thermocladium modestius]|uniref:Cobalt transporter ApaG n=1 Tax=Thermocladium modestius TaxID=62609 RepID=A0A830GVM7_9CREN|nr:Zn-ribbon domain-containing OB-fold protein [Thermocladium modestius]GGP21140.1 cobalt transporter ApaG [Thermocladium modestius]
MVEQNLSIPKYWRRTQQYYRLIATRCTKCGKTYFPPRRVCDCGNDKLEPFELPKNGSLITLTVLRSVSVDFEKQRPLLIGVVDLGGVKLMGQIVDCPSPTALKTGTPMEVVFRRVKEDGEHGIIYYGYKFRPVKGCES